MLLIDSGTDSFLSGRLVGTVSSRLRTVRVIELWGRILLDKMPFFHLQIQIWQVPKTCPYFCEIGYLAVFFESTKLFMSQTTLPSMPVFSSVKKVKYPHYLRLCSAWINDTSLFSTFLQGALSLCLYHALLAQAIFWCNISCACPAFSLFSTHRSFLHPDRYQKKTSCVKVLDWPPGPTRNVRAALKPWIWTR